MDGDGLDTGPAQMPPVPGPHHALWRGEATSTPLECPIVQQCRQHLPFFIARDEDDALINQLDTRRRSRRERPP